MKKKCSNCVYWKAGDPSTDVCQIAVSAVSFCNQYGIGIETMQEFSCSMHKSGPPSAPDIPEPALEPASVELSKQQEPLMSYEVKFDLMCPLRDKPSFEVWETSIAKRYIKSEFGLDPRVENNGGDLRYSTEDPAVFVQLLRLSYEISAGGWWSTSQKPPRTYYLPTRGDKYTRPSEEPKEPELG